MTYNVFGGTLNLAQSISRFVRNVYNDFLFYFERLLHLCRDVFCKYGYTFGDFFVNA